ncbi:hypothetical protein BDN70DRAFT_268730 [Pholiota conissans]|uniref:Uncharacterized protein n=1 Tax=Pholiota conissans TaxID=109636 RepID=A0A9P5YTL9_9AGAR|nr:hypothetical protein BDN70DRAFT_268730 [Pholiota conissans]
MRRTGNLRRTGMLGNLDCRILLAKQRQREYRSCNYMAQPSMLYLHARISSRHPSLLRSTVHENRGDKLLGEKESTTKYVMREYKILKACRVEGKLTWCTGMKPFSECQCCISLCCKYFVSDFSVCFMCKVLCVSVICQTLDVLIFGLSD